MDIKALLITSVELAKTAGLRIKQIYDGFDATSVRLKADQSPLTEADLEADAIIAEGLNGMPIKFPILSEESPYLDFASRAKWEHFWLVDPLDGTDEFIAHTDEFTVNIALIHKHQPILGVVYAPVLELCYFAAVGVGAFKQLKNADPQAIQIKPYRGELIQVVASRRNGLEQLGGLFEKLGEHAVLHAGSALKFCLVADGQADLYPRFGPTCAWDTAAGQCIVEQAGGKVLDHSGVELSYNTGDNLLNPYFFAIGDPSYDWGKFFNKTR